MWCPFFEDIALLIYRFLFDKNKGDKMELNRVIIKNNIILNKYIRIERNNQKDMTNIISVDILLRIYDIHTNKELLFDSRECNEVIGVINDTSGKDFILKKPIYLSDCLDLIFDEKEMYKIKVNNFLLLQSNYRLEYEIRGFYFCSDRRKGDIKISHQDFLKIIYDNTEYFNPKFITYCKNYYKEKI